MEILHATRSEDLVYHGAMARLTAIPGPTFLDAAVADQTYTTGQQIPELVLPRVVAARGAVRYQLFPRLPERPDVRCRHPDLARTPERDPANDALHLQSHRCQRPRPHTSRSAVTVEQGDGGGGGGGGGGDTLSFGDAVLAAQRYRQHRPIAALRLPAAQGGTAPIRYSLSNPPAGLTFDPTQRVLSGTPTQARAARIFSYRATDATGAIASLPLLITVERNRIPTFDAAMIDDLAFVAGRAIPRLRLPAASGGDGALAYSISPALPRGIAFNAATRTLSGTPRRGRAIRHLHLYGHRCRWRCRQPRLRHRRVRPRRRRPGR